MVSRLLVIVSFCFTMAGCSNSVPNPTVPSKEEPKSTSPDQRAIIEAAKVAVTEFVNQAKAGKLTADSVTVDFKKIIGEPLTPSEKEKGYSDAAAVTWLNLVGQRLQSTNITGVSNAMGLFELDAGTLRMVYVDSKWHVDWFHAGRPKGIAPIVPNDSAKRFAVATFIDPLFTHNWELSEAALSLEAKKSLAPALGNDPLGYNRGTLRGKLKDLLNGATGYSVDIAGDKATVTLTGAVERKVTLSLAAGSRPDLWLISGLE